MKKTVKCLDRSTLEQSDQVVYRSHTNEVKPENVSRLRHGLLLITKRYQYVEGNKSSRYCSMADTILVLCSTIPVATGESSAVIPDEASFRPQATKRLWHEPVVACSHEELQRVCPSRYHRRLMIEGGAR